MKLWDILICQILAKKYIGFFSGLYIENSKTYHFFQIDYIVCCLFVPEIGLVVIQIVAYKQNACKYCEAIEANL